MSSPETLSAPVSVPDSYKEAPADSVTARTVEAISEDPAVTRKRELIRSEADRLASEAQARMSGPDAPTDPTDPVWIEMRQALSRAEFMRELAAHRNPDVIRILGDRASFAQLISSDFQLLVIA